MAIKDNITVIAGSKIPNIDEETTTIKNPVVMIPVSKEKIAFQPWVPYSEDKEFKLKESMILVVATPSKLITNEFNRVYGSGIVVPTDGGGLIA